MYLLCTDLHLDDQKANEYRWQVFDEITHTCRRRPISRVYCLGDMTDKRDRFSAEMLNRLVRCWLEIMQYANRPDRISIIRGNHDTTVAGPAFWEFLSQIPGIEYVTRPTTHGDLILLPFSPNPRVEWADIVWRDYAAAFLHATPRGALAENGFELSGTDLPVLPGSLKIYSGDVHTQQRVRNWTMVGAPHPVKFGDHYPCRFLLLDEDTYDVVEEIPLNPIGKRVVEINSMDDLWLAETRPGDQVKFRAVLPPGEVDWGSLEAAVEEFARERRVEVASIEGSYDLPAQSGQPSEEMEPEELLRAFAREEEVSGELLDVGMGLLREVRG